MANNTIVTVIMPSYNEAENLKLLLPSWLEECDKNNYQMIIIDDGSNDDTKIVLSQYENNANINIIHNKLRRGYGGAIKAGIRRANTEYVVTMDADGQHDISNIRTLLANIKETDADLVIGKRGNTVYGNQYRSLGKTIIHKIASLMLPLNVKDLNSGMKMYKTQLVKRYIRICPDSMAFSDIITLVFINQGNLVIEVPIQTKNRLSGKSEINTYTAFLTIWEIMNITMLFRPIKIFLPLSIILFIAGIVWSIPFILLNRGVSVGSALLILIGFFVLFLGLIAEQLSMMLRLRIED